MTETFACDESMIINIPISSLNDAREAQLMPENFQCVYKDFYKIFVIKGKPQPLGAAQIITGVFIIILSLIIIDQPYPFFFTLPSLVFLACGILSVAAGQFPDIHVAKVSFSLNIISLSWSVVEVLFYGVLIHYFVQGPYSKLYAGIMGVIVTLLIVEILIALFLIYWLNKALYRENFAHRTAETGKLN